MSDKDFSRKEKCEKNPKKYEKPSLTKYSKSRKITTVGGAASLPTASALTPT